MGDVQHSYPRDPHLIGDSQHGDRGFAVGPDDELLNDIRIRELDGFEEIAALQGTVCGLQVLHGGFAGRHDAQGIRIDQQCRQRQPLDELRPQFLAALRFHSGHDNVGIQARKDRPDVLRRHGKRK